ncbi:MAG: nucleoside hydrolase, partial [Candidatus Scatosoma sp.]
MTNLKKIKIILDTDIGDDIDDLFALHLLANSPEVDLLGVTTVFRNAEKRAKMSAYALKELNRADVPVYAGADDPLICIPETIVGEEILRKEKRDEKGKYLIPQYVSYMEKAEICNGNAVEFIADAARKYGSELHLVLIGAYTNAALAIRMYPEAMKNVADITVMGGYFYRDFPEWNIMCDPEAAHIVFSSGIPVKAVGIDVTSQC